MDTHEFILTQVEKILNDSGYGDAVCRESALRALEYYKSSAMFRKGAMSDTLSVARKHAKHLSKVM